MKNFKIFTVILAILFFFICFYIHAPAKAKPIWDGDKWVESESLEDLEKWGKVLAALGHPELIPIEGHSEFNAAVDPLYVRLICANKKGGGAIVDLKYSDKEKKVEIIRLVKTKRTGGNK